MDETGILLGLTRTHARSQPGTKVTSLKPFYLFAVFIEKFFCPQLWPGAVVVMDNLPAHKLASIEPMINAVGAWVICLSPYSPDFNPIEAMVVATQIFSAAVLSNYHIYD